MGRVVVVGSINVDLVASVAHLPSPGETVLANELARHHGGKGANAAVAAARAGASVTMIGAVGADADGEAQLRALVAEGIDVTHIRRASTPTGTALIAVDLGGANQIVVAAGANAALEPGRVATNVTRVAGHGDVLLVSLEVPLSAVVAAAGAARSAGATIVLDPAPAQKLPNDLLEDVVCTPNGGEIAVLAETDDVAVAAARLLHRGARAVAVTLGPSGAAVWDATGNTVFGALATHPVDTTGAGDCFSGVLAAGLAAGDPLRTAVARANVAAGLSVAVAGARGGMPDHRAISQALAASEIDPA